MICSEKQFPSRASSRIGFAREWWCQFLDSLRKHSQLRMPFSEKTGRWTKNVWSDLNRENENAYRFQRRAAVLTFFSVYNINELKAIQDYDNCWCTNLQIVSRDIIYYTVLDYTVNQIDKHCVMQPIHCWYNHQMMLFKQAVVWYIACQVTNTSQQFPCTPTSQYPNQLYNCFNVCFLTSFENLFLCSCSTSVWLVMVT